MRLGNHPAILSDYYFDSSAIDCHIKSCQPDLELDNTGKTGRLFLTDYNPNWQHFN
jgi:hypothetical protein